MPIWAREPSSTAAFPIRARDVAAMGAWPNLGFLGRIDRECRARIRCALERTGTAGIADLPLHKLSAGQLQRALFARTLVQDAPLILLDEPFTAVDQSTEAALLTLIDQLGRGRTHGHPGSARSFRRSATLHLSASPGRWPRAFRCSEKNALRPTIWSLTGTCRKARPPGSKTCTCNRKQTMFEWLDYAFIGPSTDRDDGAEFLRRPGWSIPGAQAPVPRRRGRWPTLSCRELPSLS